ncbi:MAG: methyltransferase domain-containing protein [Hyphomonadaceae bacterium]|nr:methyltransferase domain-containing protein [Hyphomonadaceae bacterium]
MPALSQSEYWNGKVGEEWVRQADRMDRMLEPVTLAALERLALQRGERVLDIGCGAAATTLLAADRVEPDGHVVGVDISAPMLALGRERTRGRRIDLLEADAGKGAITGAPFDAAFSRFGVMFFDEPTAAFANLRGAVRPGGRLVFVCWRGFSENAWSSAPLKALAPMLAAPPAPPDPEAPGPFALANPERINAILAASGWRDASISPWDGAMRIGGGGDAREAAEFLMRIGPCARAVAEQNLDPTAARAMLADYLAAYETPDGVALAGACWIVSATA